MNKEQIACIQKYLERLFPDEITRPLFIWTLIEASPETFSAAAEEAMSVLLLADAQANELEIEHRGEEVSP